MADNIGVSSSGQVTKPKKSERPDCRPAVDDKEEALCNIANKLITLCEIDANTGVILSGALGDVKDALMVLERGTPYVRMTNEVVKAFNAALSCAGVGTGSGSGSKANE